MGTDKGLIDWLMDGDIAIQYQVRRDLLDVDPDASAPLQRRIEQEGWGARYLALQNPNGHWGRGFYQPKWTCTHYTLLAADASLSSLSNLLHQPGLYIRIGQILR